MFLFIVLNGNKTEDFISVAVCRKNQPENFNGTKYLSIDEIRGKIFIENWVGKQSFFVLILTMA